jgi:hypothetical protein
MTLDRHQDGRRRIDQRHPGNDSRSRFRGQRQRRLSRRIVGHHRRGIHRPRIVPQGQRGLNPPKPQRQNDSRRCRCGTSPTDASSPPPRRSNAALDPIGHDRRNRLEFARRLGQHPIDVPLHGALILTSRAHRQMRLELSRLVGREPTAQILIESITSRVGHYVRLTFLHCGGPRSRFLESVAATASALRTGSPSRPPR